MAISCLVKSKVGFYIGDPCLVLSDKLYYDYFGKVCGFKDGIITDPESSVAFVSGSTYAGDGVFMDESKEYQYYVDSGMIALIPLELIDPARLRAEYHARFMPGTATFIVENGSFQITLPNGELIKISTREAL